MNFGKRQYHFKKLQSERKQLEGNRKNVEFSKFILFKKIFMET